MIVHCGNCGHPVLTTPSELKRSKSGLRFCDRECWSKFQSSKAELSTGLPTWARNVLSSAKKRAVKKNIKFDISPQDMANLVKESGDKCQLSGILFDLSPINKKNKRRAHYPSLDRIDSMSGYIKGNVRLVCVAVNLAMNEWGQDVLLGVAIGMLRSVLPKPIKRKCKKPTYCVRYNNKWYGTFATESEAILAYVKAKCMCR